jgi:hypothetical protein
MEPNKSTDFDRFRDLTRRILTTPKAELMKHAPKAKPTTKKRAKKK